MRWIIKSSLRFQFLLIILALVFMVFGMTQIRHMPVDVYPEFNPPLVEVQTEALGLSAAEVESLITVPMEADLLNGVAWLDKIYSESVTGLSSILLIFETGIDPIRARQMVAERLTQAFALPNVSKPPAMLQPLSTTSRVMMVGLSPKNLSLIELAVLARWNIKPRLMGVPGVANVAIWGQRERQLQVQVDPKKLRAQGVTLAQIIKTTGEALWYSPLNYLESSTPGTAGWIDTPNQRLGIHHKLPISSAKDLAQVAIVENNGLLLEDVSNVVEDHQPLIGDAIINADHGLLLVIEKFPGANTLEVTHGVENALAAMSPGLTGIKIDTTIFRPANYIKLAINNLSLMVLIDTVLIILILSVIFFDWRTTLISLVAISLSLLSAGFVLYMRGLTFNFMVLAGLVIAIGAVVDDAIVDVENIVRRLQQHQKKKSNLSRASIILEAALEIRRPIAFATLIILLAVIPVFFIQGLSGAFFQPLVQAYMLAVLTSMMVALIITPVLSLTFLTNVTFQHHGSPLVTWLKFVYGRILSTKLKIPKQTYFLAGIVILAGISALPFLGISLLPTFKQTDLMVEWEAVPGTSRLEMNRIMTQSSQELKSIAGVKSVGAHIGRAIMGDAVVGINSAELWISLDPKAKYDITLKKIHEVVNGYPGLFREIQTYQPERTREALTGLDEDIVVRIYGHDLDVLRDKAHEAKRIVAEVNGVVDVRLDAQAEEPQVEIEVDLTAAQRHGLKPGDVRRQTATLLSGIQVGNLYEKQKVFDVVVWGLPEIRNSLSDIRELIIDTPGGGQVPLEDLAKVRIAPAPIIIKRDSVSRFIDVEASVNGRNLDAVAADIKDRLRVVEFPLEYHPEILGASGQKQADRISIIALVLSVAIGIFLLIQASFGTWRMAFVVFLSLPMALAGGVLTAFANGGILTIGSLVGFLTILGFTVRNSMMLISHYQNLEKHEDVSFGPKLVLLGSKERIAPIILTTLIIGLIFFSLLFFGNLAGFEILQPMAIVILGGLVTSIFFNLFVIPVLYLRFGSIKSKAFNDLH